jgi:hypothetical protein
MYHQKNQSRKSPPPPPVDFVEAYFRGGLIGCLQHWATPIAPKKEEYRLQSGDRNILLLMQGVIQERMQHFQNHPAMPGRKEFSDSAERFATAVFAAEKHLKTNNKKSRSTVSIQYEESLTKSSWYKLIFTDDGEVVLSALIKNLR